MNWVDEDMSLWKEVLRVTTQLATFLFLFAWQWFRWQLICWPFPERAWHGAPSWPTKDIRHGWIIHLYLSHWNFGWIFSWNNLACPNWFINGFFDSVIQRHFQVPVPRWKLNSSSLCLNWCLHKTTDPKETSCPKQSSGLHSELLPFSCSPQALYHFPSECLLNTFPSSHVSLSTCLYLISGLPISLLDSLSTRIPVSTFIPL